MRIDLINFMMWYQSDTKHLNYDPVTAVNEYEKFLKLPNGEASRVNENEQAKEVCHNCGYTYKEYNENELDWFCSFCNMVWKTD